MMFDMQDMFTYNATGSDYGTQTLGPSAGTTFASYNELDMGGGQTYANGVDGATPVRSPGNGAPLYLVQQIVTSGVGTGPTLRTKLCASTDSAFTASRIIADSGTIAQARIASGTIMVLPVPPTLGLYRYWRVEWVTNNTDNVFVLKAWLGAIAPSTLFFSEIAYNA